MKRLSRIVAISREIEERLKSFGMPSRQIVYLPNSADCQRFHPPTAIERSQARTRFGIPESARLVILCVGAITRRKGQHLVANALRDLPDDVHLLMVGPDREPDYAATMRQIMSSADIGGRIHRSAHVVDVEVAYRAADVFAVPSTDEGMPNALVEAMASGLACIGTPISGITDLLAEGDRGRLVRRDQAEINAALAAYCSDEELRQHHGGAARRFIVENQSREETADRMFRLMTDLVSASGAATSRDTVSWLPAE